VQLNKTTLILK